MFDAASQIGPSTACRVRGAAAGTSVNCALTNTSRTTGSNTITNWAWTVTYNYGGQKTLTQSSGTVMDFQIVEQCGQTGAAAGGANIPLTVSLTVTDDSGATATATSGQGNQPALTLVGYTCGT
jgi:hypothetical protein